jgi:hypothetical protein
MVGQHTRLRIANMLAHPLMRISAAIALVLLAVLVASNTVAPARADCGEPGQDPCFGPAPTVDQVVAIMAELTDPTKPAGDKTNIVTPGFTPEEAAKIDDHLHRMDVAGLLPLPFIITNIQSAPNNFAGATMQTGGSFHQSSAPGPIVLVDQNGHWLLTHHSAISSLDAFWYNATISVPFIPRG